MEWDIPIYEQEVLRGQLRVERQGLRTVFRADCPAWDDTIKKVWLRGNGGNLLLGTLVPGRGQAEAEPDDIKRHAAGKGTGTLPALGN